MNNVIMIQPIGDACVNVFLIGLLRRFCLSANPSGYIIGGNQFMALICKIPAAAGFTGSVLIKTQCVLRVFCKPKPLVDHGSKCLIDILEAKSDSWCSILNEMPAALPVYIIFFERAGQGGIILDRSVRGTAGRKKRNPGAVRVLV